MKKVKTGLIGCGTISDIYLENARLFRSMDVVMCADILPERASEKARQHGVRSHGTPEALLAREDIELVLNLTIPKAHGAVALDALEAGKSVYNEKPLAISRREARTMIALAEKMGSRIGCAPDTFLGSALQTARGALDSGLIGRPVAATAFMMTHGVEDWHPNPAFYYEKGGGPLFDMGPYYLTALIHLLGPVRTVSAEAGSAFPERTVASHPLAGQLIPVMTPTHIAGSLVFASGVVASLIMSFDVWSHHLPPIQIHGSEGSMSLPDPNVFGGEVSVFSAARRVWKPVKSTHKYSENSRGIGAADMAYALRSGREHRANERIAYHVLDIMHGLLDSAEKGRRVKVKSDCERPAPLPRRAANGRLDP